MKEYTVYESRLRKMSDVLSALNALYRLGGELLSVTQNGDKPAGIVLNQTTGYTITYRYDQQLHFEEKT